MSNVEEKHFGVLIGAHYYKFHTNLESDENDLQKKEKKSK